MKTNAGLLAGSLVADAIKGSFKDDKPKDGADGADGKMDGVKCPMCGGSNGRIDEFVTTSFDCPDCGAYIGNCKIDKAAAFREWLSGSAK